ncbi:dienelactone hydrolase family protein [Thermasporomyces composti]|jgi:carboxymethylenebutenolidase|uniref:Carboxymethylenebutenolidase n=1 Tax=Thermasporomyces composti TaxID=696763 RepID=A0A3D9VHK3_THECX|nr:dienelactone hydrolase family protein [Thermasporomyces composti]REF36781.1 carboxymethylenebutenolidase [Thermasporomyces composti]
MCFDYDAIPPEPPESCVPVEGKRVVLTSTDATPFAAFEAMAPEPSGAGVVILPDIRGLFAYYERLAERFAGLGIDAVAIDYFGRTAGLEPRGADFDFRAHVAQTTPETVAADIEAAVDHLRRRNRVRGIVTVGFCFGGSYSFLQAANPRLVEPREEDGTDAGTARTGTTDTTTRSGLVGVIGFYGGMRPRVPGGPTPISEAPKARVPVLGLFGGADSSIPPEQVEAFAAGLRQAGVEHTVHTYPGAPHSFFDRSHHDHTSECADAWRRMLAFIRRHTAA